MVKFDREKQKALMEVLFDSYPEGPTEEGEAKIHEIFPEFQQLLANALYLKEHGLISVEVQRFLNGVDLPTELMKITAKGIDFLLQDGGLGAILNVKTIKFHKDAVIVLEDLIALSNMSDEDKEKVKSKLPELSTEAIKTIVQTITAAGVSTLLK